MGKYSEFERKGRDFYATPYKAVEPLAPYLQTTNPLLADKLRYFEPFAGDGALIQHLSKTNPEWRCMGATDVSPSKPEQGDWLCPEANNIQTDNFDDYGHNFRHTVEHLGIRAVITNPPWLNDSKSRFQLLRFLNYILHAKCSAIFLLNGNLVHNKGSWQNRTYGYSLMDRCQHVLPIGRLKWIEGSEHSGKEDCCWYFFHPGEGVTEPKLLPRK